MSAATVEAPPRGWLMAGKAAEVSGISVNGLRELVLQGRIPRWALLEVGKKGGRYRYSAQWCLGEGRGIPCA